MQFNLKNFDDIKTADEAIEQAQNYQSWASEQSLSYGELAVFQAFFKDLADKFDLTEEFEENGII